MEEQNVQINQATTPIIAPAPDFKNETSKKRLIIISLGIIALIVLFSSLAFLVGQQNGKTSNSEISTENNQVANTQTSISDTNNITPSQAPDNNSYVNESMNFSFTPPQNFEVINDNSNEVTFGAKPAPSENPITYLTIYKDSKIPYKSLAPCNQSQKPGCGDTSNYNLDGFTADYSKISSVDASYDLVTITDPDNTTGPKQIKMIVAGPGLPQAFSQILGSFRFLK